MCYMTEKALNRIADLFMQGKTVAQIRGVITLEYARPRFPITDSMIENEIIKTGMYDDD